MLNKTLRSYGIVVLGLILLAFSPLLVSAQYDVQGYNNDGAYYAPDYTSDTGGYGYTGYTGYSYANNPSPLYVATTNPTNITATSAVLTGTVNGSNLYNTYNIETWFEYGTTTSLGSFTVHNNSNSGYANLTATLGGLKPHTVYYFRAIGKNNQGVVYGSVNSFQTSFGSSTNTVAATTSLSTPPTPPLVITTKNPVTPAVTTSRKQSNVQTAASTNVNTNTTIANSNTNVSTTSATSTPMYLTPITNPATSVSGTSADLNSLILNTLNDPGTTWFEWGTTATLGNTTPPVFLGSLASAKHVDTMSGLAPGTTYYFRAVAKNSSSKINGATLSFTTDGTPAQSGTSTNTTTTTTTPSTISPAPADANNPNNITNTNTLEATEPAQSINAIGASTFLPISLLGWLFFLVLFLVIILLSKRLYRNFLGTKRDLEPIVVIREKH